MRTGGQGCRSVLKKICQGENHDERSLEHETPIRWNTWMTLFDLVQDK